MAIGVQFVRTIRDLDIYKYSVFVCIINVNMVMHTKEASRMADRLL